MVARIVPVLLWSLLLPSLAGALPPGEQENHGASLWAPAEAEAGRWLAVAWTGPDQRGDRITVVEVDAPDQHTGRYALTRQGNPLVLPMPERPGVYQLRYLAGRSGRLLARRGIRVVDNPP